MKITLGIYNPNNLLKPVNETVVGRRGHVKKIIEDMNPSSGIWMVSLYRKGKLDEQRAVYNKWLAVEYIRHAQKFRNFYNKEGDK